MSTEPWPSVKYRENPPITPGVYFWLETPDSREHKIVEVIQATGEPSLRLYWAGKLLHEMVEKVGGLWSERLETVKPKCEWSPSCGGAGNSRVRYKFCPDCGGEIA
jgi:hypothetical protein